MNRIGVMHLIDTLDFGGAERVAVNLVNFLSREQYQVHLCTTRRDGPLESAMASDVGRLRLKRKRRFEIRAVINLIRYIRAHDIRILHAHGASIFSAILASLFLPSVSVVWHKHSEFHEAKPEHQVFYWFLAKMVKNTIVVTQTLRVWVIEALGIPSEKVHCIPNFVMSFKNGREHLKQPQLPQCLGKRLVCVANMRIQKNHFMLIKAMESVVQQEPATQLILIGSNQDSRYEEVVLPAIRELHLENYVIYLGERSDVDSILKKCDIGILCSQTEGFPLVLLEYGVAGLAVIATRVGQCADILQNGESGVLVSSGDSEELTKAILTIIKESGKQSILGKRLLQHVNEAYNPGEIIKRISEIYSKSLQDAPNSRKADNVVY